MQNFGCLTVVMLVTLLSSGSSLQCYECSADLDIYDTYDACLYGDWRYLRSVTCLEPSVCAAYHYRTEFADGRLSISRGCQAIRFGATCEDIFNDLRTRNSILPGQHICATCSEDLCNSTGKFFPLPLVLIFGLLSVVIVTSNNYY